MERMFMKMDWGTLPLQEPPNPMPLTPVPLGTDVITFDPSTYGVNVIDGIIPFPGGFSTPISPAITLPVFRGMDSVVSVPAISPFRTLC
jgi:hypothetical protein